MGHNAQTHGRCMLDLNKIYCGDNLTLIKQLDDGCIDLTVTSPPYDNLRTYNGFTWDFEGLAKELYRVTKDGGVVVWVVADATVNGSETGTSFRQALYFMECGFRLHDTMIYNREKIPQEHNRYQQGFEYMFVLSKNAPKTFNPIKIPSKLAGKKSSKHSERGRDGVVKMDRTTEYVSDFKTKQNVWKYAVGYMHNSKDIISYKHPATYPEKLAEDHIISWSNPGYIVLDPFMGSGTTAKMALKNGRKYIGFEISQEYVDIANDRIRNWKKQSRLF